MSQRIYDNHNREQAARSTRRRVLTAARSLFIENGYALTTIAAIARSADVSPQTVYAQFGGKAAVLKGVYDITLAGDDQDVPMAQRAEFLRMAAAADMDELLEENTALAGKMAARLSPLLALIYGTRAVEPDLDVLARTAADERRIGARAFAAHVVARKFVRPGLDEGTVADLLWVLNSPETYLLLRQSAGMDDDDYQAWLRHSLRAALT
ncbi:TetR/AcrR family transcriptional regulator [Nakamurella sp. GG22]